MKKHWKYAVYVFRHKWYVMVFLFRLRKHWNSSLLLLAWRALFHDLTKFYPCEWFPYVNYFYGPTMKMMETEPDDYRYFSARAPVEAAFDLAWLHHQKHNPHHWQYWVLLKDDGNVKPLWMPQEYIVEMVADWASAGFCITGKLEVAAWYQKNKNKMAFPDSVRTEVERILLDLC